MGGGEAGAEAEATNAAWSAFEPKQEELTPAAEPQPAKATEPAPAPTPETATATVTAPTPDPGTAAEKTKVDGPTTAANGPGPKGGEAEPTSAAVVEPPRPETLGKEGKKKSSMGSLFSALTPRSRRGSNT